jgi:hypothetical protein
MVECYHNPLSVSNGLDAPDAPAKQDVNTGDGNGVLGVRSERF